MHRHHLRLLGIAASLIITTRPALAVPQVPDNFVVENAAPGVTFTNPVSIAFFPSGRILVGEQGGMVWSIDKGLRHPTPLLNLQPKVLAGFDRGLVAVGVDPNYATNRRIYVFYTVDPDSNGTDDNDDAYGRLERWQISASDSNAVVASSRALLLGAGWPKGPVSTSSSHTVGDIQWGEDGSMLVSAGEGAHFGYMDPGGFDDPAFEPGRTNPHEDLGAFRAQCLESLCGKILRIDPATGRGYTSNPYYDGNTATVRSRIWAYGLRNPYRLTVRPGTGDPDVSAGDPGTVFVGDVGWSNFEEIDVVPDGGMNFGWPCYEGFVPQDEYQVASPSAHDCDTFGTPSNPANPTLPLLTTHHSDGGASVPSGHVGACITAGVFTNQSVYPPEYRGRLLYGEYTFNWILAATVDDNNQLVQVVPFGTGMDGPVDFAIDPLSGDVFYVAIKQGQVRRIRYQGTVAVENEPEPGLHLSEAMPMPTSRGASLALDLPRSATVEFRIYDVTGRAVWKAERREYPAGHWTLTWDGTSSGREAPAGLYLARVDIGGHVLARRIMRTR